MIRKVFELERNVRMKCRQYDTFVLPEDKNSDKEMQFRFKIWRPFPLSPRQWISNVGNGRR